MTFATSQREIEGDRLRTGLGVVLTVVGVFSILIGLLSGIGGCAVAGAPCPSPRPSEVLAYGGLVLLLVGIVILIRSGWRGSGWSWVIAGLAVVPATWTLYEIGRQGPCMQVASGLPLMLCDMLPFGLGQAGAPVTSAIAAGVVLVIGVLRVRRIAPRPVARSRDIPEH